MDIPIVLSANFGELRTNHFHSGVDIKTQQREGIKVFAVADGYVARIVVSPTGFGRALYIAHPDGYTTVYAHLRNFTPAIEDYVREQRYSRHTSNVDLALTPSQFAVKRGELIGYSGNSGMSYGAHLHYELRRGASQSPLNPLTNGVITVTDTIAPSIFNLYWFTVDTVGGVPLHRKQLQVKTERTSGNNYRTLSPVKIAGNGYFALESTDRKNGTTNKYVAYRTTERIDGQTVFDLQMDEFGFDRTRYVNHLVVYNLNAASNYDVVRLVRPRDVPLPQYRCKTGEGLWSVVGGEKVEIELSDEYGNRSVLGFTVEKGADYAPATPPEGGVVVDGKLGSVHRNGALRVSIAAGSLFEPIYLVMRSDSVAKPLSRTVYSSVYKVGNATTPLLKPITVDIEVDLPDSLRKCAVLASVNPATGKVVSAGGGYKQGHVVSNVSSLGWYVVDVDRVAPVVKANFTKGADLTSRKSIVFTVSDDFSGLSFFSATVDGEWVILERDVLKGTLTHNFDNQKIERGKDHTIELTVRDVAGNTTVFGSVFKY